MNPDPARRLVVGLAGPWPTPFESAWLAHWQPAGVILFSHNINNYNNLRDLSEYLHGLVPGLEIMADHEGGPISHLAAALGRPPSAWSLGVLDDVGLTARVFAETGLRLREAGIDRVLAPVADVLTEPRNPVIGVRAFGGDPELVTRHTVAAVTGLLDGGVRVCLKHWPGHGGSGGDSHLGETSVGEGAVPVPFESGLTAGADAVMVGHLLRDPGQEAGLVLPATLDREFLDTSRRRLEPGSVAGLLWFADDVTMGALGPGMEGLGVEVPEPTAAGLFDPATLPRDWFECLASAGCDRLLIRGLPTAAFPLAETPGRLEDRQDSGSMGSHPFAPGPYAESRLRLLEKVAADFPDPHTELLWLDYSRDDRWAIAAGVGAEDTRGWGLEEIKDRLSSLFRSVSTEPGPRSDGRPWKRLLVSSHRPLPGLDQLSLDLASRGVCLVLGHPSLGIDLADRLPGSWKVAALYDIAPDDLIWGS